MRIVLLPLDLGDYQPRGHFWQLLTSEAAGSGFLMFGTTLAYLMTERRRMLHARVQNEGWKWDAVWPQSPAERYSAQSKDLARHGVNLRDRRLNCSF